MGSFPSSLVVARISGGPDPRTLGSGSSGATNSIRAMGFRWGALVFFLDALKGALPVLFLPLWNHLLTLAVVPVSGIDGVYLASLAAAAAVLGHVFPVFARFKGGKGVATAAGAMMALMPLTIAGSMVVFALVLFTGGIVSLSSIIAALFLPVSYLLIGRVGMIGGFPSGTEDLYRLVLCGFLAVLITLLHYKNIRRLFAREEPAFEKARLFRRLTRRLPK